MTMICSIFKLTFFFILFGETACCCGAEPNQSHRRQLVNFRSTHDTQIAVTQSHSIEALAYGSSAFTDAKGTLNHFPLEMHGRNYVRTSAKRLTLICKAPGYIAVICPTNGVVSTELISAGFQRLDYPEFNAINGNEALRTNCCSYIKRLSQGESLDLSSWAIVVLGNDNVSGVPDNRLRGLSPAVYLPDGSEFKTWEPEQHIFTKTYYVAQQHENASDDNPGTKEEPFKTISRAAHVVRPGERVLVDAGVYRETVRPQCGGTRPDEIVSFETVHGASVVIRGSERYEGIWERYRPGEWRIPEKPVGNLTPQAPESNPEVLERIETAKEHVYRITMPRQWFSSGYNPFLAINLPGRHHPDAQLYRGLIFQDGKRLVQVRSYTQLFTGNDGAYWVDCDGLTVHVRPYGDVDPKQATFEIATREQWFAPEERELPYIRVKGFTMEYAANNFPVPQIGGLSTTYGHHWIIEDNTVRWANGVGIDIGKKHWLTDMLKTNGYHIVRNNTITDNGICGLAGYGEYMQGTLIEYNTLERNCWWTTQQIYSESAAIKLHLTRNTLIRNNLVRDTYGGNAIWLDFDIINTRVTRNLIVNTTTGSCGAFFMEATPYPNWIDHNIVLNTKGGGAYGLFEATSERQIYAFNFVGNSASTGIQLTGGARAHVRNRGTLGRGEHTVWGNLINGRLEQQIAVAGENNIIEGNLQHGITYQFDEESLELTITANEELPKSESFRGMNRDYLGGPRTSENQAVSGPFQQLKTGERPHLILTPGRLAFHGETVPRKARQELCTGIAMSRPR